MMRRTRLNRPPSLLRPSLASIAIATLLVAGCRTGDTAGIESSDVLDEATSEIGGLVAQAPATATRHHDFGTGLTTDVVAYQMVAGDPTPYVGADLAGTLFSFGDFEEVDDPGAYPARVNVALAATFGDDWTGYCSGTLIDSRHVLTAAHCLYREDIGGYADSIKATPGDGSYGWASALSGRVYTRYVDNDDVDYDIAVLEVDRPIGVLTGWHGYGEESCWGLTHGDFTSYVFPGEQYEHEMHFWDGTFDWCPLPHTAQSNTDGNDMGVVGISGGGVVSQTDGIFHVNGVWARLYDGPPAGSRTVRLWDDAFHKFRSFIQGHRSDEADLMPVGLVFPEDITPQVDDSPNGVKITVHNYADEAWDGPVTVDFYLSTNRTISGGDTFIGSVTRDLEIDPMGAVTVSVPNDALDVPLSVLAPFGDFTVQWVGAIVEVDDANADNNVTIQSDVQLIGIHSVAARLVIDEIDATDGTYATDQDLPVAFAVENRGDAPSSGWTGTFWLSKFQSVGTGSILLGQGSGPALAAGATYTDDVALDLHAVPVGDYYVHLVVQDDEGGDVLSDFDVKKITVKRGQVFQGQPANLRIDYVGFTGESFDGSDDLAVAFSVTNTGAQNSGVWDAWIYASPTASVSSEMIYLGGGSSAGLAAGGVKAGVSNLSLAKLPPGDYHVVMIVAAGDETTMNDNVKATPATFEIELGYAVGGLSFP